jgi:hypothetical protein
MRQPSYKKSGRIYVGPTKGRSVQKDSQRACLCLDGKTYSTDCCEGYLINQGIGATSRGPLERGDFASSYSNDFDIKDIRNY